MPERFLKMSKQGPAAFHQALQRHPLLFDGAMATYYVQQYGPAGSDIELQNLMHPERIENIHKQYLQAGARAIKTNTFSISRLLEEGQEDLCRKLIDQAVFLASQAVETFWNENSVDQPEMPAGQTQPEAKPADTDETDANSVRSACPEAYNSGYPVIFADLGPCSLYSQSLLEVYQAQARQYLNLGVTHFLMETHPHSDQMPDFARWLKAQNPQAVLVVSFASGSDGLTREGIQAKTLLEEMAGIKEIDAVGLNCSCGPHHLLQIADQLNWTSDTPLSLMPNAGYPSVLGRRTVYKGDPDYFASRLFRSLENGVSVVGGCCGTTPAHIDALNRLLQKEPLPQRMDSKQPDLKARNIQIPADSFWKKLEAGRKPIAVELDPPKNDAAAWFVEGVSLLKQNGADLITIADCPVGRPRADSSLLACKIRRETGMDVLPHMTCRDRNLNAAKALLLGLSMEDVHNVLLITGDPIPSSLRDEVRSVFSYNSRKLARYVHSLACEGLCQPFRMFGALNVNARNFDIQLKIAKEKQESGIECFLTQPVLSKQGLDNLIRASQELDAKILGGIYPIVSSRNAQFLKNEIGGMDLCEEIAGKYEGLDRDQAEEMALKISTAIAAEMNPYVDGFYVMTPFNRISLVSRIMDELHHLPKSPSQSMVQSGPEPEPCSCCGFQSDLSD